MLLLLQQHWKLLLILKLRRLSLKLTALNLVSSLLRLLYRLQRRELLLLSLESPQGLSLLLGGLDGKQRLISLLLKLEKCARGELWTASTSLRAVYRVVSHRELGLRRLHHAVILLRLLRNGKLGRAIGLVLACHLDEVPGQLTEEDLENIAVLQSAFLVCRFNMRSEGKQMVEVVLAAGACNGLGECMSGGFHMLLESGPMLETLSDKCFTG